MADTHENSARLSTGVPGLDELLDGGLLPRRTLLIKGPPGSAKTTLGLQMLVSAAREGGEAGMFLTFEQLPEQIIADTDAFGWELGRLAHEKKIELLFVTPEEVLQNPGRHEHRLLLRIQDWVEQTGATRILIDSISNMRALYTGDEARATFLNFMIQLKELGLTPILTAEKRTGGESSDIDIYLADSVMYLDYAVGGLGRPDRRTIEILKTRGHEHVSGAHPVEIGPSGLVIYPHTYPKAVSGETRAGAILPTGVRGLDRLLGGGYLPGSSILVAGLSGTFKTTLAAQFATAGESARGLWLGFQESSAQLSRSLGAHGLNLGGAIESGNLSFLELTPGRSSIEKIVIEAERLIAERGIDRVVIDSGDELTVALETPEERREAILWATRRLKALGAAVLVTQRLARVSGGNPLSDIGMTDLADTIVYLGLVEIESRLEKVISVLKHRGGSAEGDLRAITCTPAGLEVSERFVGLSGLLGGSAQGKRKTQIETIFQPLYFLRDFLTVAGKPDLDAERRAQILKNLGGETEKLIERLSKYFDEPVVQPKKPAGEKETPK